MKTITEFEDLKISTRGLSASKIIKKLAMKRAEATEKICNISESIATHDLKEDAVLSLESEIEQLRRERILYNEIVYSLGISERDWGECVRLAHNHIEELKMLDQQK